MRTVGNPTNVLSKMIASLHNSDGSINNRFYEDVVQVSQSDRNELAKAPFNLNEYKSDLDIRDVFGEKGYSTNERNSIRPSLDVNGIWGGYTGDAETFFHPKPMPKFQ